jgi:hypothetical protein
MDWDAFISHASETRIRLPVRYYLQLQELGLRIWFDEFTLTVGDSLRRSIDKGWRIPDLVSL